MSDSLSGDADCADHGRAAGVQVPLVTLAPRFSLAALGLVWGRAGSGFLVGQKGDQHNQDRLTAGSCGQAVEIMSCRDLADPITRSGPPERASGPIGLSPAARACDQPGCGWRLPGARA